MKLPHWVMKGQSLLYIKARLHDRLIPELVVSHDKAQLNYVCFHTIDISRHFKHNILTGVNAQLSFDERSLRVDLHSLFGHCFKLMGDSRQNWTQAQFGDIIVATNWPCSSASLGCLHERLIGQVRSLVR